MVWRRPWFFFSLFSYCWRRWKLSPSRNLLHNLEVFCGSHRNPSTLTCWPRAAHGRAPRSCVALKKEGFRPSALFVFGIISTIMLDVLDESDRLSICFPSLTCSPLGRKEMKKEKSATSASLIWLSLMSSAKQRADPSQQEVSNILKFTMTSLYLVLPKLGTSPDFWPSWTERWRCRSSPSSACLPQNNLFWYQRRPGTKKNRNQ